ncbi:MAG: aldo/keto reductase [Oscillospiraceae bacterium]|nr:aldo/keto reductase [Oscillospiraceae bacterium]
MDRRPLGATGMEVGIVSFGGIAVDGVTEGEAAEYVAEAIAGGVNYFDVAPSYGDAEARLGPALAPYRKNAYLACKTADRTAKGSRAELESSLRALRTDYLDVYQLHGLDGREDIEAAFGPDGAMETLLWAKESGYARFLGFTCHHEASAMEILGRYDGFATMMAPINYAYCMRKGMGDASLAECAARGMGVLAIKALARDKWPDWNAREHPRCWYRPIFGDPELGRLALNYALSKPVATVLPPGRMEFVRFALGVVGRQGGRHAPLTDGEYAYLRLKADEVSDLIF